MYFTNRAEFDLQVSITSITSSDNSLSVSFTEELLLVEGGTIGAKTIQVTGDHIDKNAELTINVNAQVVGETGGPYTDSLTDPL